jgi:hypothetical protein
MYDETKQNGWAEYSIFVLDRLKKIDEVEQCLIKVKVELAVLKTKIILFGAIGGFVGTAIGTLLIQLVLSYFKTTGKTP